MVPQTMQAMILTGHGGPEKLVWHEDWPVPVPGPGEVLLKVLACGLNNTDINTRTGWYSKEVTEGTTGQDSGEDVDADAAWGGSPLQFPRIQGADVVGEVVAGPDALMGRRVLVDTWLRDWDDPLNVSKTGYFGSECDGGYAQYVAVGAKQVHVVDSLLSDAELATFATSYSTAEGMVNRAGVGEGDTVLITGASGGVGGALIQLSKRRGARTIAMASPAKHAAVAALGSDLIVGRDPGNVPRDANVTVVADVVGGDSWPALIDTLVPGGRYVCSGAIAGPMVALDLRTLYLRDLTFYGSTVLPPGMFGDLVSYINAGDLKPVLAATYPLKDLHKAQEAFVGKAFTGNIVVVP